MVLTHPKIENFLFPKVIVSSWYLPLEGDKSVISRMKIALKFLTRKIPWQGGKRDCIFFPSANFRCQTPTQKLWQKHVKSSKSSLIFIVYDCENVSGKSRSYIWKYSIFQNFLTKPDLRDLEPVAFLKFGEFWTADHGTAAREYAIYCVLDYVSYPHWKKKILNNAVYLKKHFYSQKYKLGSFYGFW